jgi:transposase
LAQEGIKTAEIAARLGRHPAAVRKHIAAFKKLPPTTPPFSFKKRPGPKSKIDIRMKDRLRRYVSQFPFKTAKELKNEVGGWSNISVRIIQHVLQKQLGLPSRKASKKPLLTQKMLEKRLKFCNKYKHWKESDWEQVMFSDESTFRLVNSRGATVRRPSTISRYLQKYTIPTVKHSASVMVWGCFSGARGRGGLYFLPKNLTMNGERYRTVLENHLLPFMRIHRSKWFLQDGAPCHKSKVVMSKLKEMEKEFKVLDWPGNSPDLNPIENCWAYMKAQLKKAKGVTSLPRMIEAIKMMWVRDLSQAYFKKLSASMPKRIKQVIANKGHMTKY